VKNVSFLSFLNCFTCGKSGHIKFHCPKNTNKKKCIRCHRVGHDAPSCRAISKAGDSDNSDGDDEDRSAAKYQANLAAEWVSEYGGDPDDW